MYKNSSKTQFAYIITRVLDTPFWGLYNMFPVILYKNLQITPFEVGILVAIKPLTSLLAGYWSSRINGNVKNLVPNILWGRLIGFFPFLFIPWINFSGYFIFAYAIYMMMAVAVIPAWMEVLKLNLTDQSREKIFSYTQAFGYMGGGLLPFLIGGILDHSQEAWRWLFPLLAVLALCSLFFQRRIQFTTQESPIETPSASIGDLIKKPWRDSLEILQRDPSFRQFQGIFMLFGSGLMLLQPALPLFFVDILNLSYTEIAVALTLCKGCGFALSSPLWAKKMAQNTPTSLLISITFLSTVYPLFLYFSTWHVVWLYAAYFLYGIFQAGSELLWNLSGPYFAKNRPSTAYTTLNIAAVGIRGSFVPALGSFLCMAIGIVPVILSNSVLGFTAMTLAFFQFRRKKALEKLGNL